MSHNIVEGEFNMLALFPVPNLLARISDGNYKEWHCTALGDEFTSFAGAVFYFVISFLDSYPQEVPIVTVYTPNAYIQTNSPINCIIPREKWSRDPHARSVLVAVKSLLSGIEAGGLLGLTEESKKEIAAKSVALTRDNQMWRQMFPDLTFDRTITGRDLHSLQQQPNTPSISSSSQSSNPSEALPINPPSPSKASSSSLAPRTQQSASSSSSLSPSKQSKSSTSPKKISPATSPMKKSDDSILSTSPNVQNSILAQTSSNFTVIPPEQLNESQINNLRYYESIEGTSELYKTILSHLRVVIPGWLSSDDNASQLHISNYSFPSTATSSKGQSSAQIAEEDSQHAISIESFAKHTCSQNPSLHVLSYFMAPCKDEGLLPAGQIALHCKIRANFSTWNKIKANMADWTGIDSGNMPEGEAQREHARQLIVQVLDSAMVAAWKKHHIRLIYSEIDLSGTEGSMRAVFQGTSPSGGVLQRESEVEVLNLSSTRTSPRSLLSLHKLSNLTELLLDHCPSIQKSGKNVFSLLLKKDPIQSLRSLSVVGTSQVMSANWIVEVEQRCPNLNKLFFTRQTGVKAIGWSDAVMMQTMRDPLLLPCGHIGDKSSLLSLGYCAFDRQAFRVSELASLNPSITMLEKDGNNVWHATIVDALRRPLNAKVLYHRHCGTFYNLESLTELYSLEPTHSIDEDLVHFLTGLTCVSCKKPFGSMRICYPHSAEPNEKHGFDNLKDLSNYGALGERMIN